MREVIGWTAAAVLLAAGAGPVAATPSVQGAQVFTDNVGPGLPSGSGWRLVVGATTVSPAGPGTEVMALHQGGQGGWDVAVPATPSPVFAAGYFASVPYTGQSGSWLVRAVDGSGTAGALSHTLDDVRQLPLVQGLVASGPLLAPTLRWDRLDPLAYPSLCHPPCAVGFDFFNYAAIVRGADGTLLYQSSAIPNLETVPTAWTLPAHLLQPDQTYFLGVRLNMNELEAIQPNGSFVSPLENRSSAYLPYVTAVPEPGAAWLLAAGLASLAGLARWRRPAGA